MPTNLIAPGSAPSPIQMSVCLAGIHTLDAARYAAATCDAMWFDAALPEQLLVQMRGWVPNTPAYLHDFSGGIVSPDQLPPLEARAVALGLDGAVVPAMAVHASHSKNYWIQLIELDPHNLPRVMDAATSGKTTFASAVVLTMGMTDTVFNAEALTAAAQVLTQHTHRPIYLDLGPGVADVLPWLRVLVKAIGGVSLHPHTPDNADLLAVAHPSHHVGVVLYAPKSESEGITDFSDLDHCIGAIRAMDTSGTNGSWV